MTAGGIVDKKVPSVVRLSFPHDKVIEVPEQNRWQRNLPKGWNVTAHSAGGQAMMTRGFDQMRGFAAFSGDSAILTQFRERDMAAMIPENHAQRRGAAFHRLHLQDRGSPGAAVRVALTAHFQEGSTRARGWTSVMMTKACTRRPLSTVIGPFGWGDHKKFPVAGSFKRSRSTSMQLPCSKR